VKRVMNGIARDRRRAPARVRSIQDIFGILPKVPRVIDFPRGLYRKCAGEDAFLAHVPVALLRAAHGDRITSRVRGKALTVDLRDEVIAFPLFFRRVWEPNEMVLRSALEGTHNAKNLLLRREA